jgi:hypothetical protein
MALEAVLQTTALVVLGVGIFWAFVRRRLVRQWVIFGSIGLGLGFEAIGDQLGQPDTGWWYWSGVATGAAIGAAVYLVRRRRDRLSARRASPASCRCTP